MMLRLLWILLAMWVATHAGAAVALDCTAETFEDVGYHVCRVDMASDDLRLWHSNADGKPYHTLGAVADTVAADNGSLVFAMNAGMYHPDRAPVGLMIIEARRVDP